MDFHHQVVAHAGRTEKWREYGLSRTQAIQLVDWDAIPIDLIVPYRPGVVGCPVAAVASHGVDIAVIGLFHDTNMIRDAVLSVCFSLVPIEVDDVAEVWNVGCLLPLIAGSEATLTDDAACCVGQHVRLNVAALVGTPIN